jgi:hypothetical protein
MPNFDFKSLKLPSSKTQSSTQSLKPPKFSHAMDLKQIAILPFKKGKEGLAFSNELKKSLTSSIGFEQSGLVIVPKKQAKAIIKGELKGSSTNLKHFSREQKQCSETTAHFKVTYSLIEAKTGKTLYTNPITGSGTQDQCEGLLDYDTGTHGESNAIQMARGDAISEIIFDLVPYNDQNNLRYIFGFDRDQFFYKLFQEVMEKAIK